MVAYVYIALYIPDVSRNILYSSITLLVQYNYIHALVNVCGLCLEVVYTMYVCVGVHYNN